VTAKIILAILQIALVLLRWGQEQRWIDEGRRQEIAKNLVETLRITGYAKKALEEAGLLSDSQLDDELHKLEPH